MTQNTSYGKEAKLKIEEGGRERKELIITANAPESLITD